MNLKVLLHIRCLAIIICGIINIGDTKNDVPTYSSTSYPHADQTFTQQKGSSSQSSTKSPVHGNSYTMLSQAISHAVSHEFGKCFFSFFSIFILNFSMNLLSIYLLRFLMSYKIFSGGLGASGSADGACFADDIECADMHDKLGMEAIRTLHQQLDDDENGNIDLSESDDVSDITNYFKIF